MGSYTLRFESHSQPGDQSNDVDGWRMTVAGFGQGDQAVGTNVSIVYPFDISMEKNVRWYLETFLEKTPWQTRMATKVHNLISEYATGIFRQLPILHEVSTSLDVDTFIIEAIDQPLEVASSNIHRLHWEVLENPVVWDELWATKFPPRPFRQRKPVPKVIIRRMLPTQRRLLPTQRNVETFGQFIQIRQISQPSRLSKLGRFNRPNRSSQFEWGSGDLSDDDGMDGFFSISPHSAEGQSNMFNRRANHVEMIPAIENMVEERMDVKVTSLRILLVIARNVVSEKNTPSSGTGSTARGSTTEDIDPSLILQPLIQAIDQLPRDVPVHLEICRPGSWIALKTLLEEKGKGYYNIVHFDLHGRVHQTKGSVVANIQEPDNRKKSEDVVTF